MKKVRGKRPDKIPDGVITKSICIRLDGDTYNKFVEHCNKQKTSMNQEVIRLIDNAVQNVSKT